MEDYSRLTVVQRQTIPAALTGRDLLVQATTGAGKCMNICTTTWSSLPPSLPPSLLHHSVFIPPPTGHTNPLRDHTHPTRGGGAKSSRPHSHQRTQHAAGTTSTANHERCQKFFIVHTKFDSFTKMLGIPSMKTALVVGGLSVSNQIYRLKSGVQV